MELSGRALAGTVLPAAALGGARVSADRTEIDFGPQGVKPVDPGQELIGPFYGL